MRYLVLLLSFFPLLGIAQVDGENIYRMNCASCHSIGKGNLVGPDLKGVLDRRDKSWVKQFIKSPQAMLSEGDSLAVALFQEYNYVPMPDQLLNENEVEAVLQYIGSQSTIESTNDPTLSNAKPAETKKESRSSSSGFKEAFFNPVYWIVGITLILLIVTLFVMLSVIKTFAQQLSKSEREKKELLLKLKNKTCIS